jgi:Microtubule associated protein (MAP65/ASE1 family)
VLIQDIFTDASLASHEYEIKRLENLIESRQNALSLVKRHMELIAERQALEESSKDPSRLTQRGAQAAGRLLQEEKVRKKLSKELPKVPHFHTDRSSFSWSKTLFTLYRRGRTRTMMISWSTERDTSMSLKGFHELKKPPRAVMY